MERRWRDEGDGISEMCTVRCIICVVILERFDFLGMLSHSVNLAMYSISTKKKKKKDREKGRWGKNGSTYHET